MAYVNADMAAHLRPLASVATPAALRDIDVSMDGVRVVLREVYADKSVHAVAYDPRTNLPSSTAIFPPPHSQAGMMMDPSDPSTAQVAFAVLPSDRKRKRSVGSASSAGLADVPTTTATTSIAAQHQQLPLEQDGSQAEWSQATITPASVAADLHHHVASRSRLASRGASPDRMDVDYYGPSSSTSSGATSSSSSSAAIKPLKKRAKSGEPGELPQLQLPMATTTGRSSSGAAHSSGAGGSLVAPLATNPSATSGLLAATAFRAPAATVSTTTIIASSASVAVTAAGPAFSLIGRVPSPGTPVSVSMGTLTPLGAGTPVAAVPVTQTQHVQAAQTVAMGMAAAAAASQQFPPSPINSPRQTAAGVLALAGSVSPELMVGPVPVPPPPMTPTEDAMDTHGLSFGAGWPSSSSSAAAGAVGDEAAMTAAMHQHFAHAANASSLRARSPHRRGTSPSSPNAHSRGGPGSSVSEPLARLARMTELATSLDTLPEALQHYVLFTLLRRCSVSTLQFVHGVVAPALKRDFLSLLPYEVAMHVLGLLDAQALCRSSRVSRRWRALIDGDALLWRSLGTVRGLWAPDGLGADTLRVRSLVQIAKMHQTRGDPLTRYVAPDLMPFLHPDSIRRILDGEQFADLRDRLAPQSAHPFKAMYSRSTLLEHAWMHKEPRAKQFRGHGSSVVTCLQFDDDKIVSGSDDQSICVFDIRTGELRMRLDGHQGGVWALQYVGNTLVSGSTDRTVRVWNLATGKNTHIFEGHTSTVRCLQILQPTGPPPQPPMSGRGQTTGATAPPTAFRVPNHRGGYVPSGTWSKNVSTPKLFEPLIVTGSRDSTLRVWRLPEPSDRCYPASLENRHGSPTASSLASASTGGMSGNMAAAYGQLPQQQQQYGGGEGDGSTPGSSVGDLPTATGAAAAASLAAGRPDAVNPYFRHVLAGHAHSVRAVAGHGHIVCSGSYDGSVRVWDVVTGRCMYQLLGHTSKVYSIVFDGESRCWSGSMDATVRCWDLRTGECVAVLEGHSSLVGLLELTPRTLVSAAADATLRVWDTRDNSLVHVLQGHANAITCFQFDAHKVVSGSEGAIKMWDPRTGRHVRDLVTGIVNVWRLQINERWCVAAVNRGGQTEFVVLDFDHGAACPAWDGATGIARVPEGSSAGELQQLLLGSGYASPMVLGSPNAPAGPHSRSVPPPQQQQQQQHW
ncbi:hypothetical protein BC828DRAFT_378633 [Blastocladiella britannica]|nr:hypothetical protein BC828DRAFT_378633 [Blastocladiella britannica]